jgi:hypothetical protein
MEKARFAAANRYVLETVPVSCYNSSMSIRSGIVGIAFWTLLGAPVLCGLGVLVHLCADDLGADCHHELACVDDPCQVLIVGVTFQPGRPDDGPEVPTDVLPVAQFAVTPTPVPAAWAESPAPRLSRPLADIRSLPLLC